MNAFKMCINGCSTGLQVGWLKKDINTKGGRVTNKQGVSKVFAKVKITCFCLCDCLHKWPISEPLCPAQ